MTGDDQLGKAELDNFIDPKMRYPVIATTSKLLTTGVDAKTCKLIVLDQRIQSMTEFKQIIGRGTRIDEKHGKQYFTIIDFKRATELFADPDFDGEPVQIYEPNAGDPICRPTKLNKMTARPQICYGRKGNLSRRNRSLTLWELKSNLRANCSSTACPSKFLPSGFSILVLMGS